MTATDTVPAEPSSAIQAVLIQLTHANPLREAEAPHLLACLATISDPRGRRGRRHPLVAILAMAAAAVLAGARSMTRSPSGLRMPRSRSGWRC
jgi:DDE_Tnp_1-associated